MAEASAPQALTMTVAQQEQWVMGVFEDFLQSSEEADNEENLARYLVHVGITAEAIAAHPTLRLAILSHYCTGSGYDTDRVVSDLASYPPIAERCLALQENKAIKTRNRVRKHRALHSR